MKFNVMARITYSGMISNIRGSIGGTTFQNNTSGAIAKLKSKIVVNPSNPQAYSQLKFSRMVNAWSSLTQTQKDSWIAFAVNPHYDAWGEGRTISGYQWFLSCNLNLLQCGFSTILSTAPSYSIPAPPPSFYVDNVIDIAYIYFSSSVDLSTNYLLFTVTPPLRSVSVNTRKTNLYGGQSTGSTIDSLNVSTVFSYLFNLDVSDFFSSARAGMVFSCFIIDPASGLKSSYSRYLLTVPVV